MATRQRESKKAIDLDWQNSNFARASRFFVHFFPFTALFLISGFMEDVNIRQRFFFLFVKLDTVLYNSAAEKIANIKLETLKELE